MPGRRTISPAERRYMNHLRYESLRVASVYETKLARNRRKELKRVLALCMNVDDPDRIPDVLVDNLKETYLMDWWQDLWLAAGMPRAKKEARDLKEAKAAAEEGVWASGLRTYATTRAGSNIVSVTGSWKDSLVRLVRGTMEADPDRGVEKLTKDIYRGYLGTLEKWQCRRIAQTETMIGTAEAGDLAARTLDVAFTKQWCTSGLDNVRDTHAAVDGVEVDQEEPFKLAGGLLMFPHDTSMGADASEIINCACDVIRRPKSTSMRREAPEPPEDVHVPTEEELREQRIQEMMAEQDPDLPEDVRRAKAENYLDIEKDLGVKKGKPMSVEDADEQKANPNYVAQYIEDPNGKFRDEDGTLLRINPDYKKEDVQHEVNCVTCAQTFLLREAGFDITAKGRVVGSGSLTDKAAEGFNAFNMWMTADKKRAIPTDMRTWLGKKKYKTMTQARYKEFFEEACKEKGDYLAVIGWGKVNGHATILRREANGKLYYIEPQKYTAKKGVRMDPSELYKSGTSKPRIVDGVMRIDDKIFDTHWTGLFNTK